MIQEILLLFSRSVMSDSFRPHGLQHARLPYPSPTPRAYSNSCPLSQWCHPTISSSVVPFFSRLQSFPTSGSFQMSQFFTTGDQSIGVSASPSVLPKNTQDWSPLGWNNTLGKHYLIHFIEGILYADTIPRAFVTVVLFGPHKNFVTWDRYYCSFLQAQS